MTTETTAAVERLTRYNAWRRGEGELADKTFDDLGFTAKELGETIDTVLAALKEAEETNRVLNRRAQKAEGIIARSGIVESRPQGNKDRTLGRALANYAASEYKRKFEQADASARALCETLKMVDDCWLIRPQSIAFDIANRVAAELKRQEGKTS